MLNEIKLHHEFIIEVPYMNSRKFELLIANIEQLSVECHFKRTSRKLFIEKLKSVQYDLQKYIRWRNKGVLMVKTVYVTGYKSFELNIFKDDAPEVHYLKQFIKHKIEQLLDERIRMGVNTRANGYGNYGLQKLLLNYNEHMIR